MARVLGERFSEGIAMGKVQVGDFRLGEDEKKLLTKFSIKDVFRKERKFGSLRKLLPNTLEPFTVLRSVRERPRLWLE